VGMETLVPGVSTLASLPRRAMYGLTSNGSRSNFSLSLEFNDIFSSNDVILPSMFTRVNQTGMTYLFTVSLLQPLA